MKAPVIVKLKIGESLVFNPNADKKEETVVLQPKIHDCLLFLSGCY